jgi:hypothetical protein
VGKHVNLRILPANELAVAPNPVRLGKRVHEGLGLEKKGRTIATA